MKKIIFSLLLLSSTVVFAQYRDQDNNRVPSSVRRSFEREYPSTTSVQWSLGNGQWRAYYRDNNNRNVEAYYDRYGRRMDTHIAWDRNDVPPLLDQRINSRYHANGNYKVYRIERPRLKPIFEIRIGTKRPIYMDERGRDQRYYDRHPYDNH